MWGLPLAIFSLSLDGFWKKQKKPGPPPPPTVNSQAIWYSFL